MFIAMNRFQVCPGQEEAFEQVWKQRDKRLDGVPGFVEFHLLRGGSNDEFTLYSAHSVWSSHAEFQAWTRSDAFRQVHSSPHEYEHMYLDGPHFEGFEVVQHVS